MRALLPFVLCLSSFLSFSQILDTSHAHNYKGLKTFTVSEHGLYRMKEDSTPIDTSLLGFYKNYPDFNGTAVLDLGYEGSPSIVLTDYQAPSMRLALGVNTLKRNFYSNSLDRYHTDRAFTRVNYSQGPNELVFIEANHGQQISKRLTLGLDYRRLKNHNFYYFNVSNPDRVRFTNLFNNKLKVGYHSADRKYELLAGHIWNKNTHLATGGIVDLNEFESNSGRSKTNNIEVHLSDAKSSINQHLFKLSQFYRYKGAALDSSMPHRLDRFSAQLTWNTSYKRETLKYIDNAPDSTLYGDSFGSFADSIFASALTNRFGHVMRWKGNTVITGLTHVFDHVYQKGVIEDFNSLYFDASHHYIKSKIYVLTHLKYGISGYNSGDYQLNLKSRYRINNGQIKLSFNHSQTLPYYLHQRFNSAVRSWDITTKRIANTKARLTYKLGSKTHFMKLKAGIQSVNNLIYFDSTGMVQQHTSLVSLSHIALQTSLHSKYFGLDLNARFQNSSNQNVLPRPRWSTGGRIYTSFKIFKGKLLTQWGAETNWFSDFRAPRFDPLIRAWKMQNETFRKYPPIQLFVNAKLKSFNFGLTMFHVQEGLMGEAYYSSPNYPVMPRVMRLNVRWDFGN